MFEKHNDVVTIKELCRMLHIGRNTAYDLIHSGQITGVLVGRQIRIRKMDIIHFLSAQPPKNPVEFPDR